VKRGLIAWDRETLSPAVFEARLARARKALADRDAPALVVYSDVARSEEARHLTNFMPYWNRSLAVIPRDGAPVLLCALSPRVYPWIRSVTLFEEIRPAPKMMDALAGVCVERGWNRVGVLDLPRLIHEFRPPVEAVNIPGGELLAADVAEIEMRGKAANLARRVLEEHLGKGEGRTGHHLVGTLEREYRRAGAEDLAIRISMGDSPPCPPRGALLGREYSVAVALEYAGHWVKVARARSPAAGALRERFAEALRSGGGLREDLWASGAIYALHVERTSGGGRLFHGDTCHGTEPL
jgi:hypothetical protein